MIPAAAGWHGRFASPTLLVSYNFAIEALKRLKILTSSCHLQFANSGDKLQNTELQLLQNFLLKRSQKLVLADIRRSAGKGS